MGKNRPGGMMFGVQNWSKTGEASRTDRFYEMGRRNL